MKAIVTLLLLLVAAASWGEEKIVETDTGITVEVNGSAPASAADDAGATIDRAGLTTRIEQLKREVADLLQRTGSETPEELALKEELAQDKVRQIEVAARELGAPAGTQGSGGQDQAPQEQKSQRVPSYRESKKQQIRELKMLRGTLPEQPPRVQ